MEDVLAKLGKSKIYSSFDAFSGFYTIPMQEDSIYTGFVFQNAHYAFCVIPFGLVNAPATYARLMQSLLHNAKNLENFIDDVTAYNNDMTSHLATLPRPVRACKKS